MAVVVSQEQEAAAMDGEFSRVGLGYRYCPAGDNIRFLVRQVRSTGDGPYAQVQVEVYVQEAWRYVHRARVKLEGDQALRTFARTVAGYLRAPEGAIVDYVRDLARRVVDAEAGGAVLEWTAAQPPAPEPPYRVETLVPEAKLVSLYGPGGQGKSYLAVGLQIALALGRPFCGLAVRRGLALYCDWEDDKATWDRRVYAVCRGLGVAPPRLPYLGCAGTPITELIGRLVELVAEHEIKLVIVDSFTAAQGEGRGGSGASYEETAMRVMDALSLLTQAGAAVLVLDHVASEGAERTELAGKAYGSIMKKWRARTVWEIKSEPDPDAQTVRLGLYHVKANHTALAAPLGIRIRFAAGAVRFERGAIEDSARLAAAAGLEAQVRHVLRQAARGGPGDDGTRSVSELIEELGLGETPGVRKRIYRVLCQGAGRWCTEVQRGSRGRSHEGRWALLASGWET